MVFNLNFISVSRLLFNNRPVIHAPIKTQIDRKLRKELNKMSQYKLLTFTLIFLASCEFKDDLKLENDQIYT